MKEHGTANKVTFVAAWLIGMAATVGVVIIASTCMASAEGYTITCLNDNGLFMGPKSINARGEVAGASVFSNTGVSTHAALWSDGTLIDLDPQNLQNESNVSGGFSINNSGQVVGCANNHAVLYSKGHMTDLGTLGGSYSYSNSINNPGKIVGASTFDSTNDIYHAALFSGGKVTDLGALVGTTFSSASSINNFGQIVGYSQNVDDGSTYATLWSKGTIINLGALWGSTYSRATSINDSGQIIGYSATSAILWNNGKATILGPISLGGPGIGGLSGINNSGEVVGNTMISMRVSHATLWKNGVAIDLNSLIDATLGWVLTTATDINDAGQIIGQGMLNGKSAAFLLTPIPPPAAAQANEGAPPVNVRNVAAATP